jgi:hypothetical protein
MDFSIGGRTSLNDVTPVLAKSCLIIAFRKPAIDAKSCHGEAFKTESATDLQSAAYSMLWTGNSYAVRQLRDTPEFQC